MLDGDVSSGAEGDFDMAELADLLAELPNDGWVVERVLSESQYETTQLVHRDKAVVENVFVRKVFARGSGLGAAYQRVFAAQTAGERFAHLPLVYDMVETENGVAVVTEFLNGQTLQQYVNSAGPSVEIAAMACRELCDAMRELHESFDVPIVHRDLKPSNIIVASGKLVLIDLGIARAYRMGAERDTVRLGTPGYAPPEQFGYGQTMPQSDIYAAAMAIAFCLTGENPSPKLRESGFDDLRIPAAVRPVLVKATALDTAHRYASAREFGAAFELALRSTCYSRAFASKGGAYVPLAVATPAMAMAPTTAVVTSATAAPSAMAAAPVTPPPATAASPGSPSVSPVTPSPATSPGMPFVVSPETSSMEPLPAPPSALSSGAPSRAYFAAPIDVSPEPPSGTWTGKIPGATTGSPSSASHSTSTETPWNASFEIPANPIPETAPDEPSRISRLFKALGIVWNILLCGAWALLTMSALIASVRGGNETIDVLPMWHRFVLYFGMVIIPSALLVIMLVDKRRLKRCIPALARVSGKRLVAVCLGSIVVLYFVTFLFHFLFFGAS